MSHIDRALKDSTFRAFLAQPGLKFEFTDANVARLLARLQLEGEPYDVIGLNAMNQILIAKENSKALRAKQGPPAPVKGEQRVIGV
jgi:hypothetical protein